MNNIAKHSQPTANDNLSTALPEHYQLQQNYPNPFSRRGGTGFGSKAETIIEFSIPEDAFVKMVIYDLRGKMVKLLNYQQLQRGKYRFKWDGRHDLGKPVPSGVYLYSITTAKWRETKKLILIK